MKSAILLILLGLALRGSAAAAPASPVDSLRRQLDAAPADTIRVLLLSQLAAELTHIDPLATIAYCRQALQLAQKIGFHRGEALALIRLGSGFREASNYPAANSDGGQELLLAGLRRNLREISQHVQRATSIISSMLARSHGGPPPAHSPTNLNTLAREYLRLAYQGKRAKDKTFVAARSTKLATHLLLVPVVAPDLGHVFLNLFTDVTH